MRSSGVALCLMALFLFAGCGGPGEVADPSPEPEASAEATESKGLEVRDPTLQWVPGSPVAAVYLEIVNPGGESDRLLRVETAAAASAETHETLVEGDTVRMEARPDGFEIPAAGSLRLEPGGKHIMLIEPSAPADGQAMTITLHFEKASAIEVTLEASSEAGVDHGSMDHGSMDHGSMDHGSDGGGEGSGAEGESGGGRR